MKIHDLVYIILNGRAVVQAEILKISVNLYTVKILNSAKVIRLPKHRLHKTEEAALKEVHKHEINTITYTQGNRPPTLH